MLLNAQIVVGVLVQTIGENTAKVVAPTVLDLSAKDSKRSTANGNMEFIPVITVET